MRLPWPFSRPQPSADTSPTGEVFGARPSAPQAWRELPVMGTTVGAPPLIAPTPPFRADLAGAAQAPIALAPLTHGRGLDAPAGLARGLARPIERGGLAPSASPALRSRSQRKPASDMGGAVTETAELPAEQLAMPGQSAAAAGASSPAVPTSSPTQPLVGSRSATAVNQPAPATRSFVSAAAQSSLPLPPGGRVGVSRAAASKSVVGTQAAQSSASQSSASEPMATSVQRAPSAPTRAAARTPELPRSASDGERLTLGQSRRMGLGAPIDPIAFRNARTSGATGVGPAANVQAGLPLAPVATTPSPRPSQETPQLPIALPAAPAPEASAPEPKWALSAGGDSPTASAAPVALPHGSGRPAASHMNASQSSAHAAPAVRAAPPPLTRPAVRRAPRVDAASLMTPRALVGARPIGPTIQRAPSTGAPDQVRIRRGSEANELAGALDARAFTHAGEIYLPDSHGPLSGQKARSLLAHEMTHVAQQRRLGSSLPHEDTAHGQQLEAQAAAAESGAQLPLAGSGVKAHTRPSPGGSLAVPGSSSADGPEGAEGAGAIRIASLVAGSGAVPNATHGAESQRAPRVVNPNVTNPDDEFKFQLDSNEEYMFEKFERRLRRLLISERERGGTLIDAL